MKSQGKSTLGWYAARALATAIVIVGLGDARAASIQVVEVSPNSQTVFNGTVGLSSVGIGQNFGPNIMAVTTSDGQFTIEFAVAAANNGGVPNASAQALVIDNLGGAGSVVMSLTQDFSGVINSTRWEAQYQLTGAFSESTFSDGNSVVASGYVAGAALPQSLSASDVTSPGTFTVPGTPAVDPVSNPTSLGALVTFNFTGATAPGDSIDIPFTINPTISAIPEPSSFAMLGTLMTLSLVGHGWNRRRTASTA
jgi:hypothetical protein